VGGRSEAISLCAPILSAICRESGPGWPYPIECRKAQSVELLEAPLILPNYESPLDKTADGEVGGRSAIGQVEVCGVFS
jgi:hypothetical protein